MSLSGISTGTSFLEQANLKQDSLLEKLASGKKVNKASDDVVAQLISERLSSQSNGYQQSVKNAYDGISYAQVAESGLKGVGDSVSRIQELTTRAGSGILSDSDKKSIQNEINQLRQGIQDTIKSTTFGGKEIFGEGNDASFQVGANSGQNITVGSSNLAEKLAGLGLANIDITKEGGVDAALKSLKGIQEYVGQEQGNLGAVQNQFQSAANQLSQTDINVQAARSRISDTDYAQAISDKISNDFLANSSTLVASQARQSQESVLNLLT